MLLCESLSSFVLGIQKKIITKFSVHLDVSRCAPRGADWPRPSASVGPGGLSAGERGAVLRSPKRIVAPPAAEAATANPRARTCAWDHS